jgi:hypothetical protein
MHMVSTEIHHAKWRCMFGVGDFLLFHADFQHAFRLPFSLSIACRWS